MKTQRTIYQLIVDRSGSMSDCIDATINGFNEQLNRIKGMVAEFPEQDIRVGLTLFNDHSDQIFVGQPVSEIPSLTRSNYIPKGSTALLDSIGQTCALLSEREQLLNPIPTTFVVVILTDGYENCSRMYNLEQVRSMIHELEGTGKWTFSFIGATLDAVGVAAQMSIKAQNSYHFSKNAMKGEVWDKLSDSMRGYFGKKRSGGDTTNLFD
jgi:hypothetical protein